MFAEIPITSAARRSSDDERSSPLQMIAALRHLGLGGPALVGVRHDPHLRAFYEHLVERGKTKLQALVAAMRKLLHAIFGMFKHHQTFNGDKVYSLASAATPEPVPQEVA